MYNAVMGSLDGDLENVAFGVSRVRRILNRTDANIVNSENGTVFLELDGDVFSVERGSERDVKPYFIILDSSEAFNVSDYKMLFEVRELPNSLVMGKDIGGHEHLCRWHGPPENGAAKDKASNEFRFETIEEKLESGDLSSGELDEIKNMVKNMRNGHFFEELTSEFSSKIKEIAKELIEFRRDIKKRIEPGIVEIASRDIPEASNQLEGINGSLEKSTMKIMDINDEQMELAGTQMERLRAYLLEFGSGDSSSARKEAASLVEEIRSNVACLPDEARQVMEFIMPGLETARDLLLDLENPASIREVLSEHVQTINELCKDVGTADESVLRLKMLCEALEGILDAWGEGAGAASCGPDEGGRKDLDKILEQQVETLRTIKGLSLRMLEPLSFQDLVGQRIQRIIKLVKSMEIRIEDLIISFGIKLQKHREDPTRTYEELNMEVEQYKSELKGPQSDGEGLEQADIDQLLASL